jgi:predicted DNA binding CopG/RHH family protein
MEQDIRERGEDTMKKIDRNMPMGKLERIQDFLPSPENLAVPENTVKVTLNLSESTIEFFKKQASRYHTKYQKMVRALLDKYVEKYTA